MDATRLICGLLDPVGMVPLRQHLNVFFSCNCHTGEKRQALESEKGIVVRFVIGHR